MATFLTLPNEIKLQIIEDTAPDGIENFALCCKLIYNLANKALKQHKADKMIYGNMSFDFVWNGFHSQELSEYQKVLVLSENQRLRHYPRSAQILNKRNWVRRGNRTKESEREVRRVCDSILNNIDSPYKGKSEMKVLRDKMVAGDVGAANSLLLTLLPNVERIHLCEHKKYYHTDMIDMLLNISVVNKEAPLWMQEKLSLVKLKEITIQSLVPHSGTKIATLEAFMSLPSLRIVRGFELTGNHGFSEWLYPEHRSNVTELHFRQCNLAVTDLARLFKHLQALRVFSYDHFQTDQLQTKTYDVDALINELYTYAGKSLTYLNYTTNTPAPSDGPDLWVSQLDTLSKFSGLKMLRISRALMFIQDRIPLHLISYLPPSLEELELVGVVFWDEAMVMFNGMLSMKQTLLPNLRLVVFNPFIPFDDEEIAAYERVGLALDQRNP